MLSTCPSHGSTHAPPGIMTPTQGVTNHHTGQNIPVHNAHYSGHLPLSPLLAVPRPDFMLPHTLQYAWYVPAGANTGTVEYHGPKTDRNDARCVFGQRSCLDKSRG